MTRTDRSLKLWPRIVLVLVILVVASQYRWVQAALVYTNQAYVIPGAGCDARLLEMAHQRLSEVYGAVYSQPMIACLSEPKFGLGHTIGSTNFAPLLPSVIILNSTGQNVDVAAHEWAHAEFAHRVGFWRRNVQVPTWFDEGFAMQVDRREPYSQSALREYLDAPNIRRTSFEAMSSPGGFYHAGEQGIYHYALARCVVAQLYSEDARGLKSTWHIENVASKHLQAHILRAEENAPRCVSKVP